MAFSSEMRRLGRIPSSRLLDPVDPAGDRARRRPRLVPGEPVVVLRRLRLADGEPVALETAVLVRRTADVVMTADLERGSLHEALAAAGIASRAAPGRRGRRGHGRGRPAARACRRGDPLLVERRVIADGHGRRVEATESRYPADRYALDVRSTSRSPLERPTRQPADASWRCARARPRAAGSSSTIGVVGRPDRSRTAGSPRSTSRTATAPAPARTSPRASSTSMSTAGAATR